MTDNGRERFIRTMLGGWAYGAIYSSSAERTAALAGWLEFYNRRRPHGSLAKRPPGARLAELNNVVGSYGQSRRRQPESSVGFVPAATASRFSSWRRCFSPFALAIASACSLRAHGSEISL